jgi:hypothetical protein
MSRELSTFIARQLSVMISCPTKSTNQVVLLQSQNGWNRKRARDDGRSTGDGLVISEGRVMMLRRLLSVVMERRRAMADELEC